jgi:hypothetical protein
MATEQEKYDQQQETENREKQRRADKEVNEGIQKRMEEQEKNK